MTDISYVNQKNPISDKPTIIKEVFNGVVKIDEFALDLFKGIAFSAIVIATTEFALIFAAELDNSNMCLLGETNFTNMNED